LSRSIQAPAVVVSQIVIPGICRGAHGDLHSFAGKFAAVQHRYTCDHRIQWRYIAEMHAFRSESMPR
jgi:hypothetical protein